MVKIMYYVIKPVLDIKRPKPIRLLIKIKKYQANDIDSIWELRHTVRAYISCSFYLKTTVGVLKMLYDW